MCDRCSHLVPSFRFGCSYEPEISILGRSQRDKVWVVGMNPREQNNLEPERLETYFDYPDQVDRHFKRLQFLEQAVRKTSRGRQSLVFTDLVKCASSNWPPANLTAKARREIITNCSGYLAGQIALSQPRVLICNHVAVSEFFAVEFLPPNSDPRNSESAYLTDCGGRELAVVLSGPIGRSDRYSRIRLVCDVKLAMHWMHLDN